VEHLASIECATFYNLHGEKKMLQKRKTLTEVDMPQQSAEKRKTIERKRKELEEKRRFASRAIAAVFGGLAIIAPMLIMSLHPTKLTQLLTASLFVVSVALVLARLMEDAERKDMIAATAAYAAVLAVFVGAATTTS
jgi:VIT1/CCC1 family predicted Fe2+/Mn2+ transporter